MAAKADAQATDGAEMVSLPVLCPRCGEASLSAFPRQVVLVALTLWNTMALYCRCDESSWSASHADMQRIRAYLGREWLDAQQDMP